MKTLTPVLIGLGLVGLTVFILLRMSSRSWVEVESSGDLSSGPAKAGREASLDSDGRLARRDGFERPRGAKPAGPDGDSSRSIGAGGGSSRPATGGASGSAGGKGAPDVIQGEARRYGGVVGDPVGGGRARAGGGGSSTSIAERGYEPSGGPRERRGEVSDFLAEPPPGGKNAPGEEGDPDDPLADSDEPNDGEVLSVPLTRDQGTVADDSTSPIAEQDLEFDDDGDGVKFDPKSVLAFPDAGNLSGDAGTMMLEIEPEWFGEDEGDFSLVNVRTPNDPRNLLRVFKNGKYLRYIFADESGMEREVSYDMSGWEPGERHSVAVSWGDAATALYVDNQLIGQNTYDGTLSIRPGTPMYLGSDVPEAGPKGAGGTISNFRAFGRALTPAEILSPPSK